MDDSKEQPCGLGGWLILVGIGIVLGPVLMAGDIAEAIRDTGAIWHMPDVEEVYPMLKTAILAELVAMIAIFAASCYMIVLFFRKKRLFPKWFIALAICEIVLIPVSLLGIGALIGENLFDEEMTKIFMKTVARACIWIPYMLYSVRVKNTFIHSGWI